MADKVHNVDPLQVARELIDRRCGLLAELAPHLRVAAEIIRQDGNDRRATLMVTLASEAEGLARTGHANLEAAVRIASPSTASG